MRTTTSTCKNSSTRTTSKTKTKKTSRNLTSTGGGSCKAMRCPSSAASHPSSREKSLRPRTACAQTRNHSSLFSNSNSAPSKERPTETNSTGSSPPKRAVKPGKRLSKSSGRCRQPRPSSGVMASPSPHKTTATTRQRMASSHTRAPTVANTLTGSSATALTSTVKQARTWSSTRSPQIPS